MSGTGLVGASSSCPINPNSIFRLKLLPKTAYPDRGFVILFGNPEEVWTDVNYKIVSFQNVVYPGTVNFLDYYLTIDGATSSIQITNRITNKTIYSKSATPATSTTAFYIFGNQIINDAELPIVNFLGANNNSNNFYLCFSDKGSLFLLATDDVPFSYILNITNKPGVQYNIANADASSILTNIQTNAYPTATISSAADLNMIANTEEPLPRVCSSGWYQSQSSGIVTGFPSNKFSKNGCGGGTVGIVPYAPPGGVASLWITLSTGDSISQVTNNLNKLGYFNAQDPSSSVVVFVRSMLQPAPLDWTLQSLTYLGPNQDPAVVPVSTIPDPTTSVCQVERVSAFSIVLVQVNASLITTGYPIDIQASKILSKIGQGAYISTGMELELAATDPLYQQQNDQTKWWCHAAVYSDGSGNYFVGYPSSKSSLGDVGCGDGFTGLVKWPTNGGDNTLANNQMDPSLFGIWVTVPTNDSFTKIQMNFTNMKSSDQSFEANSLLNVNLAYQNNLPTFGIASFIDGGLSKSTSCNTIPIDFIYHPSVGIMCMEVYTSTTAAKMGPSLWTTDPITGSATSLAIDQMGVQVGNNPNTNPWFLTSRTDQNYATGIPLTYGTMLVETFPPVESYHTPDDIAIITAGVIPGEAQNPFLTIYQYSSDFENWFVNVNPSNTINSNVSFSMTLDGIMGSSTKAVPILEAACTQDSITSDCKALGAGNQGLINFDFTRTSMSNYTVILDDNSFVPRFLKCLDNKIFVIGFTAASAVKVYVVEFSNNNAANVNNFVSASMNYSTQITSISSLNVPTMQGLYDAQIISMQGQPPVLYLLGTTNTPPSGTGTFTIPENTAAIAAIDPETLTVLVGPKTLPSKDALMKNLYDIYFSTPTINASPLPRSLIPTRNSIPYVGVLAEQHSSQLPIPENVYEALNGTNIQNSLVVSNLFTDTSIAPTLTAYQKNLEAPVLDAGDTVKVWSPLQNKMVQVRHQSVLTSSAGIFSLLSCVATVPGDMVYQGMGMGRGFPMIEQMMDPKNPVLAFCLVTSSASLSTTSDSSTFQMNVVAVRGPLADSFPYTSFAVDDFVSVPTSTGNYIKDFVIPKLKQVYRIDSMVYSPKLRQVYMTSLNGNCGGPTSSAANTIQGLMTAYQNFNNLYYPIGFNPDINACTDLQTSSGKSDIMPGQTFAFDSDLKNWGIQNNALAFELSSSPAKLFQLLSTVPIGWNQSTSGPGAFSASASAPGIFVNGLPIVQPVGSAGTQFSPKDTLAVLNPVGLFGPSKNETSTIQSFSLLPTTACSKGACGNYVYGTPGSGASDIDMSLTVHTPAGGGRPFYTAPSSQTIGVAPIYIPQAATPSTVGTFTTTDLWGYTVIPLTPGNAIPLASVSQVVATSPNGIYQLQIENINTPTPGFACYDTRDGKVQWSVNANNNGYTTYFSGGYLSFVGGQLQFYPPNSNPSTGFGAASTAPWYFACFNNLGNMMFMQAQKVWVRPGAPADSPDPLSLNTVIDFGSTITVPTTGGGNKYSFNQTNPSPSDGQNNILVTVGNMNIINNNSGLTVYPGMITAESVVNGVVNAVTDLMTPPPPLPFTSVVYDIADGASDLSQSFLVGSTTTNTNQVTGPSTEQNNFAQLVVDKYGTFVFINCLWSMGPRWVFNGRDAINVIFPSTS